MIRKAGRIAQVTTGVIPMNKPLKVAAFRAESDHLFRIANVDYHACVGIGELEGWQKIANRVLASVEGLVCKRATPADLERFAQATESLKNQLAASIARIESIKMKVPA